MVYFSLNLAKNGLICGKTYAQKLVTKNHQTPPPVPPKASDRGYPLPPSSDIVTTFALFLMVRLPQRKQAWWLLGVVVLAFLIMIWTETKHSLSSLPPAQVQNKGVSLSRRKPWTGLIYPTPSFKIEPGHTFFVVQTLQFQNLNNILFVKIRKGRRCSLSQLRGSEYEASNVKSMLGNLNVLSGHVRDVDTMFGNLNILSGHARDVETILGNLNVLSGHVRGNHSFLGLVRGSYYHQAQHRMVHFLDALVGPMSIAKTD